MFHTILYLYLDMIHYFLGIQAVFLNTCIKYYQFVFMNIVVNHDILNSRL